MWWQWLKLWIHQANRAFSSHWKMQDPWKKGQKAQRSQTEQCSGCGVTETSGKEMWYWKRPSEPWWMMGEFQPAAPGSVPTLSLQWGNNAGLNAAENCTSLLAPHKQVKQLLCNVCQTSLAPSASTFSISICSDKSCDGAAGAPTAGQVLVVSCRVPAGSPGLWQGLGRSAQGSAPSFLLDLCWALASEISFKISYLCLFFFFWQSKRIPNMRRSLNHHFPSLWKKIIILCNRNNSSSPPPCKSPPVHLSWLQFYPVTAADSFPSFLGCRNPKSLCSSTDNPLPLTPDGKTKKDLCLQVTPDLSQDRSAGAF